MSVVIVDYDVGNLRSVQKALEKVGVDAVISRRPDQISSADAVVLPGVGAFAECMGNLRKYGLVEVVRDAASGQRPFLGICVGYQLLFESSEEFGDCHGFGVFKGKCVMFPKSGEDHHKIPHMGWNQVKYTRSDPLFSGTPDGSDFYFVHSFYPQPAEDITLGSTEYGVEFASCAARGKVYGVQFHPEKSQAVGLKVLENFAAMARG